MSVNPSMIIRFSQFEIDSVAFELRRSGKAVNIEPQVFELLRFLASNPGRLITKDELVAEIWHGRIVSDATLASRIKSARVAVGDDGREQKLIGTVHGRGIRFVGRVLTEVAAKPEEAVDDTSERRKAVECPSVAVLPFHNLSPDPDQEYFTDGLIEDITTALTMWRSFPVISRNSSFAYRHGTGDIRTVGRELGAHYILHGSVRRDSTRVKINAHLIDSTSGHYVWTKVFDERIDDIFMLQDELARLVAANLIPALAKVELARVKSKRPCSLAAWECCLRGRARLSDYSREANIEARLFFEGAIERDPDYSDAFGYLALSYSRDLLLECYHDRARTMTALHDAARRAVALNDESSLAHHLLSTSHVWRDELDLSVAEGRLAVALNPYDAEVLHALGNKLDLIGDPEGITFMEQAQSLNPRDPERHMYLTFLARAHLNVSDYDRSIACARNAVQWKPDYPHAYFVLGLALGLQGQCKDAKDALDNCENLHPGFIGKRENWHPYLDESRNRRLLEGLRLAGWADWAAFGKARSQIQIC